MNAQSVLHENIANACPQIHKVRLSSLMAATNAACLYQQTSLSALGRNLISNAKTKHCIKRMDRLLGNPLIHDERAGIYKVMCQQLIGQKVSPVILVDWSQINEESGFHILRASIPMGGRALTLYEEVHPKSKSHNRKIHGKFLKALKSLLPSNLKPVVVADAGFKNPWFKQVDKLGWYWVGRIRHITRFCTKHSSHWHKCRDITEIATAKPEYLGEIILAKGNPLECFAHVYRKPLKGRKKLNQGKRASRRTNSCIYGRNQREPWFIVTNMSIKILSAQQAINIYHTRMQIEESFRDNKNQRIGLSLKETKSHSPERLQVLLLIVALASIILWAVGKLAYQKGLHLAYQANTIVNRAVLSCFNLGLQILRKESNSMSTRDLKLLFYKLYDFTFEWAK